MQNGAATRKIGCPFESVYTANVRMQLSSLVDVDYLACWWP